MDDDEDPSSGCSSSVSQPFSLDYQTPSSSDDISREDSSSNGGSSSFCSANISSDEEDDSFIVDDDDESVTSTSDTGSISATGSTDHRPKQQFLIINETLPFVNSSDKFKTFLTEFPSQHEVGSRRDLPGPRTATTTSSLAMEHASFLEATKLGNMDKVKTFVKSGIDVNTCDKDGRTGLHIACSLGHTEMVQYLIDYGGNVDAFSHKNKQTPLHETCNGGHTHVLRLLLLEVADLDVVDHLGRSAAHYCAIQGEEECLEILCSQGCDVCLEDSMNRTGVHFAAMNDHCNIIQMLLERGADLDVTDNEGKTPVHYAVRYGRVKALQTLLKNAVDISQGDTVGSLPSHEAAFYNNLQCLKILLKKGTKISSQDAKGRNVIHKAAQGRSLNCLHWILSSGRLDVNSRDNSGNNGLHYAAANGFSEGYYCLIQHGASDDVVDCEGKTPTDIARKYGKFNSIMKAVDGKSVCKQCSISTSKPDHRKHIINSSQSSTTLSNEVKNTLFNIPDSVRLNNPGIEKGDHIGVGSKRGPAVKKSVSNVKEGSSHFTLAAKYYGPAL